MPCGNDLRLSCGIRTGNEDRWGLFKVMKNWLMTVIGSVGSAVALILAASAFPMMWVGPENALLTHRFAGPIDPPSMNSARVSVSRRSIFPRATLLAQPTTRRMTGRWAQ